MKKIIALILAGLMLLSLVACGGTKDETDSSDVTTDAPTTEEIVEPAKPAKEVFDETNIFVRYRNPYQSLHKRFVACEQTGKKYEQDIINAGENPTFINFITLNTISQFFT